MNANMVPDSDAAARFRVRLIATFAVMLAILGWVAYNVLSHGGSPVAIQPATPPAPPTPERPSFAAIASNVQPLVTEYTKVDLVRLERAREKVDLRGRKAIVVDRDQGVLDDSEKHIPDELLATRTEEVGLVVCLHTVPDEKPTYTSKQGINSFGSTVYFVAVAHPERKIVAAEKMKLSGSSIYVTAASEDRVVRASPEQVREVLRKLTQAPATQ